MQKNKNNARKKYLLEMSQTSKCWKISLPPHIPTLLSFYQHFNSKFHLSSTGKEKSDFWSVLGSAEKKKE